MTERNRRRNAECRLTGESTPAHRVERAIDLAVHIARQLGSNDSIDTLNTCCARNSLLKRSIGENAGGGRDKVLGRKITADAVLKDSELRGDAEVFVRE